MRLPLVSRVLLASCVLVAPIMSTWSIVVVDLATGEVGIAVATCLPNQSLRKMVCCVVPESGVSAHQSIGDPSGNQRHKSWEMMQMGHDAQAIMAQLNANDSYLRQRQIGIATLTGDASTFTGNLCGAFADGITGQSGNLVYAIQGNVITGMPVLTECEQALLQSPGSLGDKLMAAMEAGAAMGGDGRCSCNPGAPTSCGAPPPSFQKSAHAFSLIVARPGDPIGICNSFSCARGDLYCIVDIDDNDWSDPDAVAVGRQEYDLWKASLSGRPDSYRSQQWISQPSGEAGSNQLVQIVIDLSDHDGTPLTQGGATLSLVHDRWSAGVATLQAVHDHADGTYTLDVLPGAAPGIDRLRIVVEDGIGPPVTLWPPVDFLTTAPAFEPPSYSESLAGLAQGIRQPSAHLFEDDLEAWYLSATAQGPNLFAAIRTNPQADFVTTAQVEVTQGQEFDMLDLWVSQDRLRMFLSGRERAAGGEQRLWFTSRATELDPFERPEPIEELDSGFGDSGPSLSPDERRMVFASKRAGSTTLSQTKRREPNGIWEPPTRIASLDMGGQEGAPLWTQGGAVLFFTRDGQLFQARAHPSGGYHPGEPVPGPTAGAPQVIKTPVALEGDGTLWASFTRPQRATSLHRMRPQAHSLQASTSSLSISAGGIVDFQLDAGIRFGGEPFQILLGASGNTPPLRYQDVVIPLRFDAWTRRGLQHSTTLPLVNFSGQLDAQGQTIASILAQPFQLDPSLTGRTLRIAFVSIPSSNTGSFVSQVQELTILP